MVLCRMSRIPRYGGMGDGVKLVHCLTVAQSESGAYPLGKRACDRPAERRGARERVELYYYPRFGSAISGRTTERRKRTWRKNWQWNLRRARKRKATEIDLFENGGVSVFLARFVMMSMWLSSRRGQGHDS